MLPPNRVFYLLRLANNSNSSQESGGDTRHKENLTTNTKGRSGASYCIYIGLQVNSFFAEIFKSQKAGQFLVQYHEGGRRRLESRPANQLISSSLSLLRKAQRLRHQRQISGLEDPFLPLRQSHIRKRRSTQRQNSRRNLEVYRGYQYCRKVRLILPLSCRTSGAVPEVMPDTP